MGPGWASRKVARKTRTIKDATVKVYHHDDLGSLKAHVLAFVTADNFAKHLKALRWRTPYQVICEAWTKDQSIFKINPHHLIPGPHMRVVRIQSGPGGHLTSISHTGERRSMDNNVAFFGSIVTVISAALVFRYFSRRMVFEAVRAVIEKSDTVDPETIAAITQGRSGPRADLRKGGLFLAVAIATTLAALVLDEAELIRPLLGLAFFPGLIGLAYLSFAILLPGGRED